MNSQCERSVINQIRPDYLNSRSSVSIGLASAMGAESDKPNRCEPSLNGPQSHRLLPNPKQNSSISMDQASAFLPAVHSTAIFSF